MNFSKRSYGVSEFDSDRLCRQSAEMNSAKANFKLVYSKWVLLRYLINK